MVDCSGREGSGPIPVPRSGTKAASAFQAAKCRRSLPGNRPGMSPTNVTAAVSAELPLRPAD